jgi:hypothetical protein
LVGKVEFKSEGRDFLLDGERSKALVVKFVTQSLGLDVLFNEPDPVRMLP